MSLLATKAETQNKEKKRQIPCSALPRNLLPKSTSALTHQWRSSILFIRSRGDSAKPGAIRWRFAATLELGVGQLPVVLESWKIHTQNLREQASWSHFFFPSRPGIEETSRNAGSSSLFWNFSFWPVYVHCVSCGDHAFSSLAGPGIRVLMVVRSVNNMIQDACWLAQGEIYLSDQFS